MKLTVAPRVFLAGVLAAALAGAALGAVAAGEQLLYLGAALVIVPTCLTGLRAHDPSAEKRVAYPVWKVLVARARGDYPPAGLR